LDIKFQLQFAHFILRFATLPPPKMLSSVISSSAKQAFKKQLSSSTATLCSRNKHTLPDLPYDYAELEPVISAQIMELHHKKHHQTYVNNLNQAEEQLGNSLQKNDLTAQITLQNVLKFNGGGHINHSIFWTNLSPTKKNGGGAPSGNSSVVGQKASNRSIFC
jgi:hypothetical protein